MIVPTTTSMSTQQNNGKNNSHSLVKLPPNSNATQEQLKQYLAYWFQLGKKVIIRNGQESLRPKTVIEGNRYSQEFEECWQLIISSELGDCYLEGTNETIAELMSPRWELIPCPRCSMPIPLRKSGMPPEVCPCHDICLWPNTELPAPRSPVDSQERLNNLQERLNDRNGKH